MLSVFMKDLDLERFALASGSFPLSLTVRTHRHADTANGRDAASV